MPQYRVVGINFDHMHMGDLLRQVHDHPDAEIAGICDADTARKHLATLAGLDFGYRDVAQRLDKLGSGHDNNPSPE